MYSANIWIFEKLPKIRILSIAKLTFKESTVFWDEPYYYVKKYWKSVDVVVIEIEESEIQGFNYRI